MKAFLIGSAAAIALATAGCEAEPEPEVVEVVEPDNPDFQTNDQAAAQTSVSWDTNNDGIFQQAEYVSWNERGFADWDADSDGGLNEEEFGTYWSAIGFSDANGVFSEWDDDNDAVLGQDEFFDDEEWGEWDEDGDGVLQTGEFTYY